MTMIIGWGLNGEREPERLMSINYNELGDGASADTSGWNLTVCLFTSRGALSTSKRYLKHTPPPTISFRKKSKYGCNLSLQESPAIRDRCRQLNKTDTKTCHKDQPRSNFLICWSSVDSKIWGPTNNSCLSADFCNLNYMFLFASSGGRMTQERVEVISVALSICDFKMY